MTTPAVCPNCFTPFFKVKSISQPTEKINRYGRKEISFTVDYEDKVHYNPTTHLYECEGCGTSFTLKEFAGGTING